MTPLKDKIPNVLDEARMLILGGQVLISVGTEAVLQSKFDALSSVGRAFSAAGTTGLTLGVGVLIWPAAYHIVVCRGEDRPALLRFANRALCFGLFPFAIGIAATLWVVVERLGGTRAAAAVAIIGLLAALGAWYVFPMARAAGHAGKDETGMVEPTDISDKIRHVLTETRMVLPGAQALLAFGSMAVLMDAFDRLPLLLKTVHACGLGCIVIAVILLMMPAAYHRIAENGESSERFYTIASRFLLAAMAALAPGMAAAVWIVVEVATGSRTAAVACAAIIGLFFYGAWFGWTWLVRRRNQRVGNHA